MNKYVFVAVFMCALAFTNAKPSHDKEVETNSSESGELEFKKIAQQIKDQYNTSLLLDIATMAVGEEVQNCIEAVELGNDTFCHMIQENFVTCFKPVAVVINTCMPEESKDLPFMIGKMIHGVIEQACHSTVEDILEIFNPCIYEKDPETIHACEEIDTVVGEHQNKLPSKSLICQTLPKVKNCAKAMVDGSCKNQVTKNAVLKFHDAIEHSVKEDCDALNKA
ncbi:unnamed protein product [Psylliodes chrysocephalus]|uniref:Uncharacterized protein n=1 Tax=Psylliodes chrysocephalus TaxID=3402493 RepID=A0A9P0CJT7_9CUCU|nr:unnamed protein product [Psylliodes chrysocephala]